MFFIIKKLEKNIPENNSISLNIIEEYFMSDELRTIVNKINQLIGQIKVTGSTLDRNIKD